MELEEDADATLPPSPPQAAPAPPSLEQGEEEAKGVVDHLDSLLREDEDEEEHDQDEEEETLDPKRFVVDDEAAEDDGDEEDDGERRKKRRNDEGDDDEEEDEEDNGRDLDDLINDEEEEEEENQGDDDDDDDDDDGGQLPPKFRDLHPSLHREDGLDDPLALAHHSSQEDDDRWQAKKGPGAATKGKGVKKAMDLLDGMDDFDSDLPEHQKTFLVEVCTALGGFEEDTEGNRSYVKGDECMDCINDLLRSIRKDNEDTNGVIHLLTRWGIIQRDLIPIIQTYSKDTLLLCMAVRLMVYMTKPISISKKDPAGHIKLMHEQKLALLGRGVLPLLVKILLEAVVNAPAERTDPQLEILQNVLLLFRNLALVPDTLAKEVMGPDRPSRIQDLLVMRFEEESVYELLLTLAGAIDEEVNSKVQVDNIIMEIIYLSFNQTTPEAIAKAPLYANESNEIEAAKESLRKVVEEEEIKKKLQANVRKVPWSRHHRFGGSYYRKMLDGDHIAVKVNRSTVVENRLEDKKRTFKAAGPTKKSGTVEAMFAENDARIGIKACSALKRVANEFLETGYHSLLNFVFKKLKMAYKVTEKDFTHFFWIEAFFLRYFLLSRPNVGREEMSDDSHPFGHISISMELETIRYMLNRVKHEYLMAEPKDWSMIYVCLSILKEKLRIMDIMQKSNHVLSQEFSTHLQNNLYYDNVIIQLVKSLWSTFKIQGQKYLETLVEVTHLLIRLVENFTKNKKSIMVAKQVRKRKSKTVYTEEGMRMEETGAMPEPNGTEEFITQEKKFEFDSFMEDFYDDDVISAYCDLVGNHAKLTPQLKAIVIKFIHRAFVVSNQQAIFFKLTNLERFRKAIETPTADPEFKQLHDLLVYIFRQLFKMLDKNPILHLEILFAKKLKDTRFIQFGLRSEGDFTDLPTTGPFKKGGKKRGPAPAMPESIPAPVKHVPKPLEDGASDISSSSDDDSSAEDEDDGGAVVKAVLEVQVIGEHSTDQLVRGIVQYIVGKNKAVYLQWLHEIIMDSLEGNETFEQVEPATDYGIIPVSEDHWGALNDPYIRLLLRLHKFTPPRQLDNGRISSWIIPADFSLRDRHALATLIDTSNPQEATIDLRTMFRDQDAKLAVSLPSGKKKEKKARGPRGEGRKRAPKVVPLQPRQMSDTIEDDADEDGIMRDVHQMQQKQTPKAFDDDDDMDMAIDQEEPQAPPSPPKHKKRHLSRKRSSDDDNDSDNDQDVEESTVAAPKKKQKRSATPKQPKQVARKPREMPDTIEDDDDDSEAVSTQTKANAETNAADTVEDDHMEASAPSPVSPPAPSSSQKRLLKRRRAEDDDNDETQEKSNDHSDSEDEGLKIVE